MRDLARCAAEAGERQSAIRNLRPSTPEPGPSDLGGIVLNETYRLLEPIGHGGMSTVYAAQHLRLGHRVAVKVLSGCLVADRYSVGRFRREAELLSQLHHPHIVRVLDFDLASDGRPYLVTELLAGEPLDQRLARVGRLPLAEVVRIVGELGGALGFAHERRIIHRDLKPSNVFLERIAGRTPTAKLLDFGISKNLADDPKLTCDFALVGTPQYMSPEQAFGRAKEIDHRADQYALALLAYEMLAGCHPFADRSPLEVLEAVRCDEPVPLSEIADVPEGVARAIERGMSKHPADRYFDILELSSELASACEEQAPLSEIRPRSLSAARAERLVGETRDALERGSLGRACELAQDGIDALEHSSDPRARALLELSIPLFEHIFLMRAGGLGTRLKAQSSAHGSARSAQEAFVLSRSEDALTLEELLDVSALPRPTTLSMVARLLDQGLLAAG